MADVKDLERFARFIDDEKRTHIAGVQLVEGTLLVEHKPGLAPTEGAEAEGLTKAGTLPPEVAAEAGAEDGNAITKYEA